MSTTTAEPVKHKKGMKTNAVDATVNELLYGDCVIAVAQERVAALTDFKLVKQIFDEVMRLAQEPQPSFDEAWARKVLKLLSDRYSELAKNAKHERFVPGSGVWEMQTATYADNAGNRALSRVGQSYQKKVWTQPRLIESVPMKPRVLYHPRSFVFGAKEKRAKPPPTKWQLSVARASEELHLKDANMGLISAITPETFAKLANPTEKQKKGLALYNRAKELMAVAAAAEAAPPATETLPPEPPMQVTNTGTRKRATTNSAGGGGKRVKGVAA